MAKGYEEYLDEDEACLECGELNYMPSKTPGLCHGCWDDLYCHENRFEQQEQVEELQHYHHLIT